MIQKCVKNYIRYLEKVIIYMILSTEKFLLWVITGHCQTMNNTCSEYDTLELIKYLLIILC